MAATATNARKTSRSPGAATTTAYVRRGTPRYTGGPFNNHSVDQGPIVLKKTTIAFTAALVAASASFAQVDLGAGAKAGTGATVTLPAPATDKASATTGVGTGASVQLPAPAAEHGAKTEAGVKTETSVKTEAGADTKKKPAGKAARKSGTELGAGAAGSGSVK